MFLTVHTSSTLLIASRYKKINIFLAFIIGVLSHFVLDFIPHGDESLVLTTPILTTDILLGLFLIFLYFKEKSPNNKWVILILVFSSWLPDVIRFVPIVFDWHFMDWFINFHNSIHNHLGFYYPLTWGLVLQAIFIIVFMWLALGHWQFSKNSFKIER